MMRELASWIEPQNLHEIQMRNYAHLLVPTVIDSSGELDFSIGIHQLDCEDWLSLHWKKSMKGFVEHWHMGDKQGLRYPVTITDVRR